ncbi:MAG: hypothetical protein M1368_00510, partial [Thaumarchaeota archaeon]|nr:hypothetical protein [Nitrososphaerota archaeon]
IAPIPALVPIRFSLPELVCAVLETGELKDGETLLPDPPENAADAGIVSAPVDRSKARKANETKLIFVFVEENPENFTGARESRRKYKCTYCKYE